MITSIEQNTTTPQRQSSSNTQGLYPSTDLVILAGGQARRMNGINKLLQRFDAQIQLLKIYQQLQQQVAQVWVNSHRDHSYYRQLIANIRCFVDDQAGFMGPLMGMKSAWTHSQADYILFVPCDVTYIPEQVLSQLHQCLIAVPTAQLAYLSINQSALYPFCLAKRSSLPMLIKHLQQPNAAQRSLKACFQALHAVALEIENPALIFHSINGIDELQQYQSLQSIR